MAKYDWVKRVDLSRFSARERILMLVTGLATAIFLLFYLYFPAHRQAAALIQERDRLDQELRGLEQQLDESLKIAEQMRAINPPGTDEAIKGNRLREEIRRNVSGGDGFSLILEEINRLAKAAQVEFVSVRPEKVRAMETLWAQPVLIETVSTFRGMGRYLEMLENLPRMVSVETIKIESDPDQASSVLAKLYLTVYLDKD